MEPGYHRFCNPSAQIQVVSICDELRLEGYSLKQLTQHASLINLLHVVDVADSTAVLHYINGHLENVLTEGIHAFWTILDSHTFETFDMSDPLSASLVPRTAWDILPQNFYRKFEVAPYQKALLYFDYQLVKTLDEGIYYFWTGSKKVDVIYADTRLLQLDLTGQEILTQDKVPLRVNFVCHYRITDPVRLYEEVCSYEQQLHILVQLALRDYIGARRLDDLLAQKAQLSDFVFGRLKEKEADYFVTFTDAGVRDFILPGEIRAIMTAVLTAEKQAQANVITRREETASTRSLLNTARLMDENQTLYKLKELEYMEKICAQVGQITLGSGSGLIQELTRTLKGD